MDPRRPALSFPVTVLMGQYGNGQGYLSAYTLEDYHSFIVTVSPTLTLHAVRLSEGLCTICNWSPTMPLLCSAVPFRPIISETPLQGAS